MQQLGAAQTAERLIGHLEPRWKHVQGVAGVAERIADALALDKSLVAAAWLHDVGYAPALARTGFHPLDGARRLQVLDFSPEIVSLVAFHTGAEFEARERGLEHQLGRFPRPDQNLLDGLILADLSVSPEGNRVHPRARVEEILSRYPRTDPVNRAVTRSKDYLMACATRAAIATGSPNEWGFAAA